jgi:hypothetical protein
MWLPQSDAAARPAAALPDKRQIYFGLRCALFEAQSINFEIVV